MLRLLSAAFAVMLFVLPATAQECMKWEDGVNVAARYSHDNDDRVSAVLLTEEETVAVWAILMNGNPDAPVRFGVMVAQSSPDVAFVAGFDELGCLAGKGNIPFGKVLDALVKAGVKSEFVVIAPVAPGGDA